MDKKLVSTFLELVKIPSPSGREKEVISYIKKYLSRIGVKSYTDNAGKFVGSNSGNLIAKIGSGKPTLMFIAHVDTVEDGKKQIKPIIKNGRISSDGTTILGSDDKGAVAPLLEAIKEFKDEPNLPTIYCVFSVTEEAGLMGIEHLKINEKIDFAFDLDSSDTPGLFINKALGYLNFDIHIYGKEAHAASHPEKGANAIKTAGLILSRLQTGKDSKGGTLNIGKISGGRAMNVVPGHALLEGEIRGFTSAHMQKKLKEIKSITKKACKSTGCKYKFVKKTDSYNPPFITSSKSKIILLAKAACKNAKINFSLKTLSATIQANILSDKGYSVLGFCKGGNGPHSVKENISVKELEQTKKLILAIVRQAKRFV